MCDLSQAESWIVAYLADDADMKLALNSGIIHETTASRLYNKPIAEVTKVERYAGKQCNHAFAYRMEPKRHMETVNKYSTEPPYITINISQSTQRFNVWHSTYTNVRDKWWPEIDYAILNNRMLTTPYGFQRHFFGGLREGYERQKTLKVATAFKPQSTVADHAFGAVQRDFVRPGGIKEVSKRISSVGLGNIINTSHDSVCVECKESDRMECAAIMIDCMKRPLIVNGEEVTIPVDCEIGVNYGEMMKMKKKVA